MADHPEQHEPRLDDPPECQHYSQSEGGCRNDGFWSIDDEVFCRQHAPQVAFDIVHAARIYARDPKLLGQAIEILETEISVARSVLLRKPEAA